ncbi:MAG TPA: hypothetical protein VHG72_13850 [Polyangia bacterium]|nr:hypothetical protein [Polyangia bacterium]
MTANGNHPPPNTIAVPERGDVVKHGFGETTLNRSAETASTAMAAQATAAVQARHVVALKQPRDLLAVRARLLRDCARPAFADAAIYHKPVGDGIEGPSIRLAEAAARAMTNIYSSVMAIYDDPKKRIIRVTATDLESNLTFDKDVTVPKTMERSKLKQGQTPLKVRFNSKGNPVYLVEAETDDDILNTENALASKALRVCLLRLIPGDILDEAINEAQATLSKGIKDDPDKALKQMCDTFELQLGIVPAQLAEYLGHPMDKTTIPEIAVMRKLFAALKDGETTWAEVMESRGAAPAATAETPKTEAPKGKQNLTDVAAAAKAKRESKPEDAISKPVGSSQKGQTTLPVGGSKVPDPDDEDAAARAATAPTAAEIAANGPPPVREPGADDDETPPWGR